jgi:hypothetical protein
VVASEAARLCDTPWKGKALCSFQGIDCSPIVVVAVVVVSVFGKVSASSAYSIFQCKETWFGDWLAASFKTALPGTVDAAADVDMTVNRFDVAAID